MTLVLDACAFVLSLLEPRMLAALAWILGVLTFDVLRIRRKVVLGNLDIAFGESKTQAQKVQIARASVVNFFLTSLEFLTSKRNFPRMKVDVENDHHLKNALAKGEGAYVMCIHLGNWELMCHVGTARWAKVNIVAKPVGPGAMAKWVDNLRRHNGSYVIDRKGQETAATQIFHHLNANEIVGFIVDQRRSKGARVPFFSKPAQTNTSLFQLWMRKPSPIVPVYIRRTGPFEHTMGFLEPFEVEKPEGMGFKDTVIHNTARMNRLVEKMVLISPEEYFWMHKRWK